MVSYDRDFDAYMSGDYVDEVNPKTLYVGNLDAAISEEFLLQLFSQIGVVNKCKIIYETGNDPYAFVEFAEHVAAVNALTAMNKRKLLEKEMKVNWATSPGHQQKTDTSKHFHIFVGDLSPEIDNKALRDAFAPFGEISDAKVIRDLQTLKSKGFGFVSFVNRDEAEKAIEQMNGQWIGRRTIRTNWATRKPPQPMQNRTRQPRYGEPMTYESVYAQSSPTNCSVYIGNTNQNTTETQIRETFSQFGLVVEVRVFKQQGYCFVRFANKESATSAIVNMNGKEFAGSIIRCSWGKEDVPQRANQNAGGGAANNANAIAAGQALMLQQQQQQQMAAYAQQLYNPAAATAMYQQYYDPAVYQQYMQMYQQQLQQQQLQQLQQAQQQQAVVNAAVAQQQQEQQQQQDMVNAMNLYAAYYAQNQ